MKSVSHAFVSRPIQPLGSTAFQNFRHLLSNPLQTLKLLSHRTGPPTVKSQQTHLSNGQNSASDEEAIPAYFVKTLTKFKSSYNDIKVLEVSRRADHPFAGSRLLLLDTPGNIHSISFQFKSLTDTYFDVFGAFPPILPPGPLGILGFGAGSAARLILELYPQIVIHGWELDPSVLSVGRQYFGLSELQKQNPDKLFIYTDDALKARVRDGFSGILVDLFSKGGLIPELQDSKTWERLKRELRKGGRIMVNCGGSCVEAEDIKSDGNLVMEGTLKAMDAVFPGKLFVLNLGYRMEDSCIAFTGDFPELDMWKQALPSSLERYVDMWAPFNG